MQPDELNPLEQGNKARSSNSLLNHGDEKWVYLVTTQVEVGKNLLQQISHFGYRGRVVSDLAGLEEILTEHLCVAILIDLSLTQIPNFDIKHLEAINQRRHTSIPLMYFSERDDQKARLMAIRAGGTAFFPQPIDIVELIDKLDSLNVSPETHPYRVLIVEDQITVANYYQMILRMANMQTRVVTDPHKALQNMDEFNPDLVLMDLYMPDNSGTELARLIRQIDRYISIPIIFLSSEDEFSKQMEVMSLGVDDFLTKPIKAEHLIALAKNRLERLRNLRTFMVCDSLTGLLNHTSFNGQLKQEINRCQRQGSKLALAMLDLDHFKDVNDVYGHSVGDTVLMSLSRLLRQRLRKSDIIGRYGGEEFIAILLDADAEHASNVMNEIRIHFSELDHFTPDKGVFQVTFSCGIAVYPQHSNASLISDAADRALYQAKAGGRNLVVVADEQRT